VYVPSTGNLFCGSSGGHMVALTRPHQMLRTGGGGSRRPTLKLYRQRRLSTLVASVRGISSKCAARLSHFQSVLSRASSSRLSPRTCCDCRGSGCAWFHVRSYAAGAKRRRPEGAGGHCTEERRRGRRSMAEKNGIRAFGDRSHGWAGRFGSHMGTCSAPCQSGDAEWIEWTSKFRAAAGSLRSRSSEY